MMRAFLPLLVMLTGCVIRLGPQPEEYPPAKGTDGAWASVTTMSGSSITGELLEVRDTAWVIASSQRVVLVPFRVMRSGSVDRSEHPVAVGQRPGEDVMQDHRLLSRFPYGVSDSVLQKLLVSKGQTAIEVATQ